MAIDPGEINIYARGPFTSKIFRAISKMLSIIYDVSSNLESGGKVSAISHIPLEIFARQ